MSSFDRRQRQPRSSDRDRPKKSNPRRRMSPKILWVGKCTFCPGPGTWLFCELPPPWLLIRSPWLRHRRRSPPMGTTVMSHVSDLPFFYGTSVRPSGRLPSDRARPWGSLTTGIPAEAKERAIRSFNAWCLAVLPGALLHRELCSPFASTNDQHWHWCSTQKLRPSRSPTPTLTASSSNLKTQDVIGMANSQSPLCGVEAARKKRLMRMQTKTGLVQGTVSQNTGPVLKRLFWW